MSLVFLYGTLKLGCSNHRFLAGQQMVGEAQTVPGFVLYGLKGYPGMVPKAGHPTGVTGEVWSVDEGCLERLDELEGTDEGLYRREAVPLLPPFADRRVEAYLYIPSVEGCPLVGSTWAEPP